MAQSTGGKRGKFVESSKKGHVEKIQLVEASKFLYPSQQDSCYTSLLTYGIGSIFIHMQKIVLEIEEKEWPGSDLSRQMV